MNIFIVHTAENLGENNNLRNRWLQSSCFLPKHTYLVKINSDSQFIHLFTYLPDSHNKTEIVTVQLKQPISVVWSLVHSMQRLSLLKASLDLEVKPTATDSSGEHSTRRLWNVTYLPQIASGFE